MSETTVTLFSEEILAKIEQIIGLYEKKRAAIIPILNLAQELHGVIRPDVEAFVAQRLEISLAEVREVVSFYTLLRIKPVGKCHIQICTNVACGLSGAKNVLKKACDKLGIKPGQVTEDGQFSLEEVECLGACELAPVAQVNDDRYVGNLDENKVEQLISNDQLGTQWMSEVPVLDIPRGKPLISKLLNVKDVHELETYQQQDGYKTATKVMQEWTSEKMIEEVKKSNLRGLGGAGFPVGMKWSFIPKGGDKPKYLVVNADEGEPGTFKDKYILAKTPHLLIEGMIIAAFAHGIHKAYIYIRKEYDFPYKRLEQAVQEAYARGIIGKNTLGQNYELDIVVHRGAGAYICGEESALLSSLEGYKGFPRLKPPFPAVVGLFGCPTLIHNVETLAYLPYLFKDGAEVFAAAGTERNGGVKLFCVSGHVERPGVYEIPMGTTLRELIYDYAGGVRGGRKLKAVIPGGISANILTADEIDVKMDFDSLKAAGTMLGSSGVIVLDETVSMVEALSYATKFFAHESCGQCSPCREGTGWINRILKRFASGEGRDKDLGNMLDISSFIAGNTICAFGDAAAMPVNSYIGKFRQEFEQFVEQKKCLN